MHPLHSKSRDRARSAPRKRRLLVEYLEQRQLFAIDLQINKSSMSEKEGLILATVTRIGGNTNEAMEISLDSNDATEAIVDHLITIPANQTSVTFPIRAVDDALLDGSQTVRIRALNLAFETDEVEIVVEDYEKLILQVGPTTISEKNGQASGIVSRPNTDIQQAIQVQITASDGSIQVISGPVTIPAGASSTSFTLEAIDNALLTGTRSITLIATSAGYIDGDAPMQILDSEQIALQLQSNPISENGGRGVGKVLRSNTNNESALTVQLTVDPASGLQIPSSVVIPAGSASATFDYVAIDNQILEGSRTFIVSAFAVGYEGDSQDLVVTDDESLSLSFPLRYAFENTGTVMGRVTRNNTNIENAILVQLHATSPRIQIPSSVIIPANESSVDFAAQLVDDSLANGVEQITVEATSPGYKPANSTLGIMDDENVWHNPNNPVDTNADGLVTPLDALLIINALNLNGPKPVSEIILPYTDRPFQIDVNGDGVISPLDALIVINHLNRFGPSQGEGGGGEGGEGEGGTDQGLSGSAGQTFWAIQPPLQSHDAIDENEGSMTRRRRITWLARS